MEIFGRKKRTDMEIETLLDGKMCNKCERGIFGVQNSTMNGHANVYRQNGTGTNRTKKEGVHRRTRRMAGKWCWLVGWLIVFFCRIVFGCGAFMLDLCSSSIWPFKCRHRHSLAHIRSCPPCSSCSAAQCRRRHRRRIRCFWCRWHSSHACKCADSCSDPSHSRTAS